MSKKRTILLIDDSDYIIEGTASLLRFEGYTVLTASDGRTGLALAQQHHPHMVICDVSMPEMDGYTVLEHLRRNPETASMRFIFLTARGEKSDMRIGMDIGADDYLIKPFSIDELLSAIEAQWKKVEVLQRNIEEVKLSVTYALPHEFRTALNQILGSASTLKATAHEPKMIAELADDITAGAQRLLRITENFLVYAQLEVLSADRWAIDQIRTHRTDEAAAVVVDIASTKARLYGRTDDLHISGVCEGIVVTMSSESFHKVLDELIDNAFKFSSPGSAVELRLCRHVATVEICITDHGYGMTTAQINSIAAYKQFGRLIHEQQGVGLGLVIAKRLIELHDGKFAIESEPGIGTTITCTIPLA